MKIFTTVLLSIILVSARPSPRGDIDNLKLPPQAVYLPPISFAVMPENGTYRQDFYDNRFNPTNTTGPFFQVFHPDFLELLGDNPSFKLIAHNPNDQWQIAHEAPVYIAESDELFFASNAGGPDGHTDLNHNNHYFSIKMKEVEDKWETTPGAAPINVTVTALPLPNLIQMTNGATGPYKGNMILVNSGRGPLAPTVSLVNPKPPYNTTILLDNYYGRQFNSLNDVKVHPTNGRIYFTDVDYGYLLRFRDLPLLPNQIYSVDPETQEVRIAATGFSKPNGLAFTPDGKTAYIGDSGGFLGFLGRNSTEPSAVYAFDVDESTHILTNRRVFAFVDSGVPDGIQIDSNGNIYVANGDGVHVWNPAGMLLGKFYIGGVAPSVVFAGPNRLVVLGETMVYVAMINAKGTIS